jgi:hypothetical protein
METLIYILLHEVEILNVASISYKSVGSIEDTKSLIYGKNISLCTLKSQKRLCISGSITTIEDTIQQTQQCIATDMDGLELLYAETQRNKQTLQKIRNIRKLYRGVSSVLDNTIPSLYHTLYIIGHFNMITHSILDKYDTITNAMFRIAETIYTFDGDNILTPYIQNITNESMDPVSKAVFFAYNDSVRHTSKFSNDLQVYRKCILSFGQLNQTDTTKFISFLVHNYVYTNHNYPPIIFKALHIILHELKLHTDRNSQFDWLNKELVLLEILLTKLEGLRSYHDRIALVVQFEKECTLSNVHLLGKVDCSVELICSRIIQSYKYTSVRMNSAMCQLIEHKPEQYSEEYQHPIRLWICLFIVLLFMVLISKITLLRRIRIYIQ